VLVVGTAGFEPATPCSQSQIGQGRYLARRRTAQVVAAMGLSVGVRMPPLVSVVNGTVVARPMSATYVAPGSIGYQVDRWVRPDPGAACLVGKGRRPTAAVGWDSKPLPCCFGGRGLGREGTVACGFLVPIMTARARGGPPLPDAVRTQHGPRVRSRLVADASGAPVLRGQRSNRSTCSATADLPAPSARKWVQDGS
jgi:hypothetical protein